MASVFRRQMVNTSALWGMPHKKALFAAHNEAVVLALFQGAVDTGRPPLQYAR